MFNGSVADIATFVGEVQRRCGMRPVYPLEFPIDIGDLGTIANDGSWRPASTVRHLFNAYPGRIRTETAGPVWTASSGGDVSFTMYAKGETSALVPVAGNAKARVEIEFGSHHSFLMAASGITIRTAADTEDLIDRIHLAYHTRRERPEEGRWYKDLMFVLAVADAERFTAMLPLRGEVRVAISRWGPFGPPTSLPELASIVRFGVGSEDCNRTNQRQARGRFYRAYKLRAEVLERWREEPWSKSRDVITFEWPTASFDETFYEV
jgi:hypothetical protein